MKSPLPHVTVFLDASNYRLTESVLEGLLGQVGVEHELRLVVHLLGTGLPIMIFIYSILMSRYARITASTTTTVLLGALSYAVLHVTQYWTVYDSVSRSTLSVIFVLQTFFWPGLIKSFFTVRTGNAWVHLWAYHAVAPHVTSDTPNIVRFFSIK